MAHLYAFWEMSKIRVIISLACIYIALVKETEQCGEDFYGSSGNILSPGFPLMYENNLDCNYHITAPKNTSVNITIVYMDLESCCDFLEIFDGPSNNSERIVKYTGRLYNTPVYSTSNQVLIHFITDNSVVRDGFNITFTSKEVFPCGGAKNGTAGSISSPGYPEQYDNNLDCYYTITTPEDTTVSLNIINLDLENNADYIDIRDGAANSSELIGRFTGHQNDVNVNTSSNQVLIYLHTDGSVQDTGFYINFTATVSKPCGGEFHASSGNISSPGYPEPYANNLDCNYLLATRESTFLKLRIVYLSLQSLYDYIDIYDGPTNQSYLIGRFTGSYSNYDISASTNQVLVYFHTDNSAEFVYSGFEINFSEKEACGENVTASSGNIHSQNFPSYYDNNLDCYYTITTSEDTAVYLTIVQFYLSSGDYVDIYDGPTSNSKLLGLYTYSYSQPAYIYSTTNQVLVYFHTDSYGQNQGFNISFIENDPCGRNINASSGNIQSPGYPEPYFQNLNCSYLITTSSDTHVTLEIVDLDLRSWYDYVYVYDGPTTGSKLLGSYTGRMTNVSITASTNQVYVIFDTDGQSHSSYDGFDINFKEKETEKCQEHIFGTYGTLLSPDYLVEPYYANYLDCYYRITTSIDTAVTLNIVKLKLENYFDYIDIYDGPNKTSGLIGRYTDTVTGYYIYATTNEVLAHFHSDATINNTGFHIQFNERGSDHNCPAINYNEDSGFLTSPLFPANYPNNSDCYYSIKTSQNSQITFHSIAFDVETAINCTNDFIEIYDGTSTKNRTLGKVCGSDPFQNIISSTNNALVHFHSDSTSEGLGFNVSYNTNPCPYPIEQTGSSGTINSPGYPLANYPNFANCNYTITTPVGSQVSLQVNYFNLQQSSYCANDYLKIYDMPENKYILLANLCGSVPVKKIKATSNKVILVFHTDSTTNNAGFSITYTASFNRDN